MVTENEEFQASLPRSWSLEGDDLELVDIRHDGEVIVSDGTRSAIYSPRRGEPLKGDHLRILPRYVEAGWFGEANCVTLSDGERTALYEPVRIVDPEGDP